MPRLTVTAVLDILAVAFVIYQLLLIVRGTRAAHVLAGILTVVIAYGVAYVTGLEALRFLISSLAPYSVFAIIVLFQSEIRRTLARLGRKRIFGGFQRLEAVDELLLALDALSRSSTGALIVMERDIGLRTFIESGVRLDSVITRDLMLSIFMPGAALHDGAVIIQKDRVSAAACFLPLSVNAMISSQMGTRHRAGLGITEETDCLALVVSEETGSIAVAAFGEIERGLSLSEVEERINRHFGQPGQRSKAPVRPEPVREAVESER